MTVQEVLKKLENKSKTVDEIRRIYSEIDEDGHRWVHFDDIKNILEQLLAFRVKAHSYEDGEEIQVNITDWDSSNLLTFGSEEDYRRFCKEVAKLQRH